MSVKGVVLALSLVAHSDMSVVVALAVPPRDLLTVGAYQPNGLAEVCPPNLHHCPAQCPLGCLKLATPASLKHCFVSICFVITHTAAHTHTHTCVHPGAGLQLKLAALREDDNVFDVSYEGQGEDSATASATDVKCCVTRLTLLSLTCCILARMTVIKDDVHCKAAPRKYAAVQKAYNALHSDSAIVKTKFIKTVHGGAWSFGGGGSSE
eukprot:scaffold45020_cov18-Tisochrysis_lutea.AAC.1